MSESLEAPLSRFVLGPELARGGMAAVHVATDTTNDQTVAVKLLFNDADDEARARFQREVRATAGLSSKNICGLIAWGVADDAGAKSFLAMEFVDGPTLHALSRRARLAGVTDPRDAMPARVVVEVLRQLLEGLATAHDAGILHRDLKPANVMIDRKAS